MLRLLDSLLVGTGNDAVLRWLLLHCCLLCFKLRLLTLNVLQEAVGKRGVEVLQILNDVDSTKLEELVELVVDVVLIGSGGS